MKKIGEGYYYSVYELSPTRVVKRETDRRNKLIKLLAWYGYNPVLLLKKISSLEESRSQSMRLSKSLAEIPALNGVLGNPVFINDGEYEQDKAIPLGTVLDSKGEDEFLSCIQEYLDANLLLWRYGYGEIVYNFTLNAGISNTTGRVILFDFNELTQNKEELAADIASKKWTTQASMRGLHRSHPALYAKVQALMESAFTTSALERNWEAEAAGSQ